MRAWVASSLVVIACAGCSKCASGTQAETLDPKSIEDAKRLVGELDKARRDALAAARTHSVPREDLGPCPEKFDPLFSRAGADPAGLPKKAWGGYDVPPYDPKATGDLLGDFSNELCAIEGVGIELAGEVADKPGPRAYRLNAALRGAPSAWEIKDLLDLSRNTVDFELVIDKEVPAKVVSDKEFEPGVLRGRFYVWDNAKRAIVCAARVLVASSERLRVEYQGPQGTGPSGLERATQSGLVSDLREQAFAQVKSRLFVAGPVHDPEPDVDAAQKADAGR